MQQLNLKKRRMKNNRFVVIDFETLENLRSSVCELGLVVIENNEIVDSFYSRVCPPSKNENYYCVKTHGIRYKDVKNSPTFDILWNMIDKKYIKGSPIISHNIGFEKSCINECSDLYHTNRDYIYYDTLAISKKYAPELNNHRLDTMAKYANHKLKHHHNALEDAIACANIFIFFNKKYDNVIEDYGNKKRNK